MTPTTGIFEIDRFLQVFLRPKPAIDGSDAGSFDILESKSDSDPQVLGDASFRLSIRHSIQTQKLALIEVSSTTSGSKSTSVCYLLIARLF